MKTVKIIGISIAIIIVIVVLVAYLLPRRATVERKIIINSSNEVIFEQINDLKNWEKWSPWYYIDTATVYTFSEQNSGKGANYSWVSEHKNVGKGSLTILESFPNDSMIFDLSFENQGSAVGYFNFKETDLGIEVTLRLISDSRFNPMARYFNIFIDKPLGKDFDKGLNNLKLLCENLPQKSSIKVEEVNFEGCRYIGIMDSCNSKEIGLKMGKIFGQLAEFMAINNIEYIAPPISIYYFYSDEKIVFEVGMPIAKDLKIKSDVSIEIKELPAFKVALANYYGSYNMIYSAYTELEKWFVDNGKIKGDYVWEEYVTDPATEPDTNKWFTKVYFQIK